MWFYRLLLQLSLLGIMWPMRSTADNRQLTALNEVFDENLDSIFKVGPGFAVFNETKVRPASFDDVICPERLNGMPFCTEVPDYLDLPKLDNFNREDFEKFKSYFKDDFVIPNVKSRIDGEPMESYFCDSRTRLIYPKVAQSRESKWLMVVQHPQYKQGVLVEQCENEDAPCKYEELLPFYITTKCRQHFVYRNLVVVVDGRMQENMVKLPNACKCVLRNIDKPRRKKGREKKRNL
ncbi:protein spaetzle-like [Anastrepha ludens]|uniref:protein spaetzle-like n=1 Tax=Anastrepha ludens TaxID=28586 RepID=UPI0023AFECA3|nr:protein spaetzle-like [Anastrepha ludens]XP_053948622.1 protein spaetzle-like [Anastrepha ludens]XP_053948623.1 protein spaetzle-like [Anastrepha ludens]